MKHMIKTIVACGVIATASLSIAFEASAQSININEVLRAAQSGASKDRNAERARENRFRAEKNKEQGRLTSMTNERVRQERISKELEAKFDQNDLAIVELQEDLRRELGDLKQLFGVIQLSASEAQEDYRSSLISAQYPERSESLREMVAKPVNFITGYEPVLDESGEPVTDDNGKPTGEQKPIYEVREKPVTRIGVFNVISGNDNLIYRDGQGLVALERQMRGDYNVSSNALQDSTSGTTSFMIDPARGGLLQALVLKPSLDEKAEEGGIVGYVIMVLGAIALLIAIIRLKVFQDNPKSDPESLELRLGEAMLKEAPKINRGVMFIKIIAVVAPLLGLLGTVTGMIQTFQAITLYGAGDPQTMAGGISQALVTTVLGLVVAIPCVFAHWLVSNKAKNIEGMLEEQAAGLVAQKYESQG